MNKLQVAMTALGGAIGLVVIAFLIWTSLNFDVLVKAIKYPEAVRELKIEVRVAQFSK